MPVVVEHPVHDVLVPAVSVLVGTLSVAASVAADTAPAVPQKVADTQFVAEFVGKQAVPEEAVGGKPQSVGPAASAVFGTPPAEGAEGMAASAGWPVPWQRS